MSTVNQVQQRSSALGDRSCKIYTCKKAPARGYKAPSQDAAGNFIYNTTDIQQCNYCSEKTTQDCEWVPQTLWIRKCYSCKSCATPVTRRLCRMDNTEIGSLSPSEPTPCEHCKTTCPLQCKLEYSADFWFIAKKSKMWTFMPKKDWR